MEHGTHMHGISRRIDPRAVGDEEGFLVVGDGKHGGSGDGEEEKENGSGGVSVVDALEDLTVEGCVTFSGPAVVGLKRISPEVRTIRFGDVGAVEVYGETRPMANSGFMQNYVKVPRTFAMLEFLKRCGVQMPARSRQDVALATYSRATLPAAFENGTDRLRAFMLMGDRVSKVLQTASVISVGGGVAQIMALEAKDADAVCRAAKETGFVDLVLFGEKELRESTVTVVKAVEAVVGVVSYWRNLPDVARVASVFGLVDNPERFVDASVFDVLSPIVDSRRGSSEGSQC